MKFNRPLGLLLSGGGALGAWQAGCLEKLWEAGLEFDHIVGISVGALHGAAYFLGNKARLRDGWLSMDRAVLRWDMHFKPISLFSSAPIYEAVDYAVNEKEAQGAARCRLTVISLCREDRLPIYAEFSPKAAQGWDAPLSGHLAASCSIPLIFPPVRMNLEGQPRTLIDGGVPGRAPLNFESLAWCREVLVLEMVRPDELGLNSLNPLMRREIRIRNRLYEMISEGLESLRHVAQSPRVIRMHPSRRLEFTMLSFRPSHCIPAFHQGREDAQTLLADPLRFIAPAGASSV